jgi:two-component sensor histidine kinase
LKTILEKRREIKDELLVLTTILSLNVSNVTSERIQKIVGGLENRVFAIREVENYENI